MKLSMLCLVRTAVVLSLISASLFTSAAEHTKPEQHTGEGRRHMGPPQAAIDACNNKMEGDSVTFVTRRGDSVTGICHKIPEMMVAIPAHRPKHDKPEEGDTQ